VFPFNLCGTLLWRMAKLFLSKFNHYKYLEILACVRICSCFIFLFILCGTVRQRVVMLIPSRFMISCSPIKCIFSCNTFAKILSDAICFIFDDRDLRMQVVNTASFLIRCPCFGKVLLRAS
jgi:hypothetical protein